MWAGPCEIAADEFELIFPATLSPLGIHGYQLLYSTSDHAVRASVFTINCHNTITRYVQQTLNTHTHVFGLFLFSIYCPPSLSHPPSLSLPSSLSPSLSPSLSLSLSLSLSPSLSLPPSLSIPPSLSLPLAQCSMSNLVPLVVDPLSSNLPPSRHHSLPLLVSFSPSNLPTSPLSTW